MQISAVIITRNEERNLERALASLAAVADEVIVVDSGSTDRTREIAERAGARFVAHAWEGYAPQKNFAANQAHHDWILSIDADERLSIELADEIVKWKSTTLPALGAAYSMPRRTFYLGKWIRHSGWYPDRKIRLYDRRVCRWEGDFVHEYVHNFHKTLTFVYTITIFPFG